MQSVKDHIQDILDYHFENEHHKWKIFNDNYVSLNKHLKKKVRWLYKDFPKAINPSNSIFETILYFILHLLGNFVPILNVFNYKRFFNLLILKVKVNAEARYETKEIKNHKRDRRFKKGYRDESIRWQQEHIEPNKEIPYWSLTRSELKRNKMWAIGFSVSYLIIFAPLVIGNLEHLFLQLFFLVIGLVLSLFENHKNKLGVPFNNIDLV